MYSFFNIQKIYIYINNIIIIIAYSDREEFTEFKSINFFEIGSVLQLLEAFEDRGQNDLYRSF